MATKKVSKKGRRIDSETKSKILTELSAGGSKGVIAKKYGTTYQTVRRIVLSSKKTRAASRLRNVSAAAPSRKTSTDLAKENALLRAEIAFMRSVHGITDEKELLRKKVEFLERQLAVFQG
jgi:hypothetical protein